MMMMVMMMMVKAVITVTGWSTGCSERVVRLQERLVQTDVQRSTSTFTRRPTQLVLLLTYLLTLFDSRSLLLLSTQSAMVTWHTNMFNYLNIYVKS